jgi:hypothetical protein
MFADRPLREWGRCLMESLDVAKAYIRETGHCVKDSEEHWSVGMFDWLIDWLNTFIAHIYIYIHSIEYSWCCKYTFAQICLRFCLGSGVILANFLFLSKLLIVCACRGYFKESWEKYLKLRNISDGQSDPVFPEKYDFPERDAFYKSVSHSGWGGSSGHDAPMIAWVVLNCFII